MSKILIIKTGATGDVVRTTVLLHLFLNDEVTWITSAYNMELLPGNQPSLVRVVAIEQVVESRLECELFDLVISLDEDHVCAELATRLARRNLIGCYLSKGQITYTETSREWFDMGLISRFGKSRANELKWTNTSSYQQILFRMLGYTFDNEESLICSHAPVTALPQVGMETRSGNRWPTKRWNGYQQLAEYLASIGQQTIFFENKFHIRDYISDISSASTIVCGDTLCLHLALALKKPVVAIFTCTSPVEIHGYGRLTKVVSPYLEEAYYRTDYCARAVESISVAMVSNAMHAAAVAV